MQEKLLDAPTPHQGASHLPPAVPPAPKKGGAGKVILWLVILAVAAGAGYYYYHGSQGQQDQATQARGGGRRGGAGGGPVPVVVATALQQDLPVYVDGLGSVTGLATVTMHSNVNGILTEVDFKEGQDVKEGDLLAVIDPRPYQVALAQAQANLLRDTAQLKDAKLDQQRYIQLAKEGVIPQQQSDTQNALADQLEGAVAGDQAAIDSAKLNIVYCHITSPVDGRVGLRLVDPGNIVHTTDTQGMLLITQMEPITVIFVLPEDTLPDVQKAMKRGALTVKAMTRDNGTELATGTLLTIDNTIDPTTGTYKLRAIFDNKDRNLWPNQFVNARLLLDTEKNAVVVPTAAIQNGGNGTFIYTVGADKTAKVSPVKVGVTEGNSASIAEGIAPGSVVVIDGQDRLRAGMPVDARFDTGSQPPAAGGAPGGRVHSADNQGGAASGDGEHHGGEGRRGNGGVNGKGSSAGDPPTRQGKNTNNDGQYPKRRS